MHATEELLDERAYSKLQWRCRRGLLENDLFIERFFKRFGATLTLRQANALGLLMDLSDNDLLDVHMGRKSLAEVSAPMDREDVHEVLSMLRKTVERSNMKLADNKATLSFSNGSPSVELPVYQGSVGPDVVDIRKLYAQTGMFTYDPGFLSTASCQSAITYIDGDKGELLYRGYPIEQLATNCDFMETCHLLLYGNLPDVAGKAEFTKRVTNHTMVNEQMQFFLRGFRRDAHPMAIMTGLVGALSAFYHDSTDINNPEHREVSAIRLIAKMPTLVAMAYKSAQASPTCTPRTT